MKERRKPFFTAGRTLMSVFLLIVIFSLGGWLLLDGKDIAIFNPQGVVAAHERDLLVFTLALSLIVIIPVFTMLGVFAWRYREDNHDGKKVKHEPDAKDNNLLEVIWWGIPIMIIGVLSVVTWVSTHQLDPQKSLDSDVKPLKVQVVALQWKWLFLYPEQQVATVNVLKMPANVPVDFEITADAPMSAFWIPHLGTQTYAMNGMSSKLSLMADQAGSYRGSNTNISGEGYADMHFMAEVLPNRKAFDAWAAQVRDATNHVHMDGGVYEKLAKPSKNDPPRYYHLHDTGLYAKVIDKYMHHGGIDTTGGDHEH